MSTTLLTTPPVRFSTYSSAPSLHPSIAPTMTSSTSTSPDLSKDAEPSDSSKPHDSARNTIIKDSSAVSITSSTADRSNDLKEWADVFDRMADQRLEKQRFVPSGQKTDEISTNALGAKLERALGRRMSGQDAVFKSKEQGEKVAAT